VVSSLAAVAVATRKAAAQDESDRPSSLLPWPAHDVCKGTCDRPTLCPHVCRALTSVRVTAAGTSAEARSSAPELMGESRTCVMPHMDVRSPEAGRVPSA